MRTSSCDDDSNVRGAIHVSYNDCPISPRILSQTELQTACMFAGIGLPVMSAISCTTRLKAGTLCQRPQIFAPVGRALICLYRGLCPRSFFVAPCLSLDFVHVCFHGSCAAFHPLPELLCLS